MLRVLGALESPPLWRGFQSLRTLHTFFLPPPKQLGG